MNLIPFAPNFNDGITTTDDVVMILVLVAIYAFLMLVCQLIIDSVYMYRANQIRKKIKKQHEFPKYLEDNDE